MLNPRSQETAWALAQQLGPQAVKAWLHLGAQLTLYAAEVNVVLTRKLYPRSLLGPPEERADEETLAALAKVEERDEREQVDVTFHE